jgi:copper chaperone NosL
MTITDPRFSAQLLTRTGRALSFDDVGCVAAWMQENPVQGAAVWVVDFVDHSWIPADSAVFLRSDSLHTPMASGLAALRPGAEFDSVAARLGGERLDWSAVQARPHTHGVPAPS